uniref:Uncharacterized protein n=1 Tax=Anguilla anguilla TaxID=7936 RepID=A0A0E9T816_ANGAN
MFIHTQGFSAKFVNTCNVSMAMTSQ